MRMQTIITPYAHSQDEHAIVAQFDTHTQAKIARIQQHLVQLFGDALWLQRPPALHSTLMEIICNAEYQGLTRKEYFMQWYAAYNEVVAATLADTSPFDIQFTELYVSQRAIIIKTADSRPFNLIRERLLAVTSLPAGTKMPPSITHCSLARFNTPLDLAEVRSRTADIAVDIRAHVASFSLIRDLGPPDFNGKPMQIYSLGG
jgi:hypothetical protein